MFGGRIDCVENLGVVLSVCVIFLSKKDVHRKED